MKKCLLILLAVTFFACAKKEEETTTTPADGSQSAAQLAGTGQFCVVNSGVGGSYAYVHYMTLTSGGSYTYSVFMSDSATCATSTNSGGTNYATYSSAGTFVVGGTAGTPSTGTKITFTMTSATMIVRASGNAVPQNLAAWLNTCTPNPAFSAAADSTRSLSGNACTTSGAYTAVTLPVNASSFKNTVYRNGTTFSMGASTDLWRPGSASFPTAYSENFLGWN